MLTSEQAERIESQYIPEPNSGCWLWFGATDSKGYGNVRINYKQHKPHRVVYEAHKGPIPGGLHLDHLCRTPACVNPDHLEPVTNGENRRRGLLGVLKTECLHGHPLSGENLYLWRGLRQCRRCRAEKWLRSKARAK